MSPPRPPRALVIAYDFPPHAAIGTMRTLRVVRRLAQAGWSVTVLTSDPRAFLPTTPNDPALMSQVPAGVTILRAGSLRLWSGAMERLKRLRRSPAPRPAPAESPEGDATTGPQRPRPQGWSAAARLKDVIDAALAIPDREVGWLLPALSKGAWKRLTSEPPDVIYSSAPPWTGQLVAAGLKAVLRRPWVADFRDPWSRAPWRGDRYRFAMRVAGLLERMVVGGTNRIVFVAEGNRDDFARHYGPAVAAKFHVVSNGCDPGEFDAIERPVIEGSGPHVMLHAGSLYAGRTPAAVFRALARTFEEGRIDRRRFRLRFLGTNASSLELPGLCRELGIEDVVEFLPRVPRAASLRAMVSASSLLLLQPGHTVSVPGKVYQYLAAGRPIFALAEESETAYVVRRSGLGVSVTPESEAAIADGLVAVVNMGDHQVRPPARELYDGNLGAATIEGILREAVAASVSSRSSGITTYDNA